MTKLLTVQLIATLKQFCDPFSQRRKHISKMKFKQFYTHMSFGFKKFLCFKIHNHGETFSGIFISFKRFSCFLEDYF